MVYKKIRSWAARRELKQRDKVATGPKVPHVSHATPAITIYSLPRYGPCLADREYWLDSTQHQTTLDSRI